MKKLIPLILLFLFSSCSYQTTLIACSGKKEIRACLEQQIGPVTRVVKVEKKAADIYEVTYTK